MTRKDYVKFAAVVSEAANTYGRHGHWHVVNFFKEQLADIFAADNPRFDSVRFLKACEAKDEQQKRTEI